MSTGEEHLNQIPPDQLDYLRKLVLACEKPDQIMDLAIKAYLAGQNTERMRIEFIKGPSG